MVTFYLHLPEAGGIFLKSSSWALDAAPGNKTHRTVKVTLRLGQKFYNEASPCLVISNLLITLYVFLPIMDDYGFYDSVYSTVCPVYRAEICHLISII